MLIVTICFLCFVGQRNVRQGRRRLKSEIIQLKALLEKEKRKKEKYKKRYQRMVGRKNRHVLQWMHCCIINQ